MWFVIFTFWRQILYLLSHFMQDVCMFICVCIIYYIIYVCMHPCDPKILEFINSSVTERREQGWFIEIIKTDNLDLTKALSQLLCGASSNDLSNMPLVANLPRSLFLDSFQVFNRITVTPPQYDIMPQLGHFHGAKIKGFPIMPWRPGDRVNVYIFLDQSAHYRVKWSAH